MQFDKKKSVSHIPSKTSTLLMPSIQKKQPPRNVPFCVIKVTGAECHKHREVRRVASECTNEQPILGILTAFVVAVMGGSNGWKLTRNQI